MGAGHDHGHGHSHAPPTGTAAAAYRGRLRVALAITLGVMVVQIVGGVLADSLALIADAAHMATDALGLGMALLPRVAGVWVPVPSEGGHMDFAPRTEDEAGPYQTLPYPCHHWHPVGTPVRYPHEYVRAGTAKLSLTMRCGPL